MKPSRRRSGFTLIELVLVIAVLLILAAVTLPSFEGLKGNADQRAGADMVRGRIADAHGLAMEHGTAYRLALSPDGTTLRVAPDTPDFATVPAADAPGPTATVIETKLNKVTAGLQPDADDGPPAAQPDGWMTIGTFLSDGTCREDNTVVEVYENTFPPLRIQLRGVTGTSRILTPQNSGGAHP